MSDFHRKPSACCGKSSVISYQGALKATNAWAAGRTPGSSSRVASAMPKREGASGVALRNGRPGAEFVYDRRTADAAEASEPAGRRLIEGDQLFTLYPFEISLGHACSAAKGSAVLLAAHGAVAIARPVKRAVDFEFDTAA